MAITYQGTTAGSTVSNPPVLMMAAIAGHVQFATTGSTAGVSNLPTGASGAKVWFYASSNAASEMVALNTINDGVALGMSIGDILMGVTTTAASTAPISYFGALVTSAGATGYSLSSSYVTTTAV